MTTSTVVAAVPVSKTIAQLAAEFITQGCSPDKAFELAEKQFDRDAAAIVAYHETQSRQISKGYNLDGIPCDMVRKSRGGLEPCVREPSAILVAGSSNAKGDVFSCQVLLYLKQRPTSTSVTPAAISAANASASSTCEMEDVGAVQFARIIADQMTCRLFVKVPRIDAKTGKQETCPIDKHLIFDAIEYNDRKEWLQIVLDEFELFWQDKAEIVAKLKNRRAPAKRR